MTYNPFSLKDKTILITGASSGIGRQCAIDCSKMGAKVVMIARNEERLNETLRMMDGDGHSMYIFDLNNVEGIKELVSNIVDDNGKLDGFVHAAGIEMTKPVKLLTHEDYQQVYRVNTVSGFEFVRQFGSIKTFNKSGG